jgi:aryl-alcohol dehydrogenase-like predicted oxidoreductase
MLGGNVFGWTADETTSFAILDAFVAAGGNFIDTANVYSTWAPGHVGGESESVLGKWFKRSGKRRQIVLATKVGMQMAPDRKGLSALSIEREVEESLRRLESDYIDVYFSHSDDTQTPLEETLRAYEKLITGGKVRLIGASNYTSARLREALELGQKEALPGYQVVQPHYNLCVRSDYESTLEPICTRYGLGVVTYYSLASGFLTGKYRTEADLIKSPRGRGGVKAQMNSRGFRILEALDAVAERLKATDAQVALAWLMARKSVTAPIASATTVAQVEELAGAMHLQLDQEAIESLNQASAA